MTTFAGLRSVLVVRHGYLAVEGYYHGRTASEYHNVFSVAKSVTSALVGIALGDHRIRACTRPSANCSAGTYPAPPTPAWPR